MPKTLAHPTASPTTDYPVFGDLLTGGGAVPAGKDKIGQPSSQYVRTLAGLWIPQMATAAGASLVSEYNADALLAACTNLFNEMRENRQETSSVRAELLKQTELGMAMQAYTTMPGIKVEADGHAAVTSAQRQGIGMTHNLGELAFAAQRKYVGIDAGAYVSPAAVNGVQVTFTGVLLVGRAVILFNSTDRTYHSISTIVDPAGGAVGTFQVSPPIPSANAVLRIPYNSTPHAWNSATDALQTLAVVGDPPRINGPATFISQTAATDNATYQWVLPCANYGRYGLQIVWTANGGSARTWVWNVFGKIDDGVWPAAGAIPGVYNINTLFQVTAGSTAFGAAPATSGATLARMADPAPFNSIAVEALVAADDANTTTVTAWLTLQGGTK